MNNPAEIQSARIAILYEKYYDFLKKQCIRRLSGDPQLAAYAEDIVQEAFIEAIEKWDMIANHEILGGWLMIVCKNKILNVRAKHGRRNGRHAFSLDDETKPSVEDRNTSIERITEKEEAIKHLDEILALLTDVEESAVVNHLESGMTISEMAEADQTTEGSQKAALQRAKKKAKMYRDKNFMLIFFVLMVSFLNHTK